MSIENINDIQAIWKELSSLPPKEAAKRYKELVEQHFYKVYGRYESNSGRLFFEMYHQGDDDTIEQGSVVYHKGEVNKDKLEEDLILPRAKAVEVFRELTKKGYHRVFEAVTKADMDTKRAEHANPNQDILGMFYDGKRFLRIDQYGDNFSIQRGYDGRMNKAVHEQTIEQARSAVEEALSEGYYREGQKPVAPVIEDNEDWLIL